MKLYNVLLAVIAAVSIFVMSQVISNTEIPMSTAQTTNTVDNAVSTTTAPVKVNVSRGQLLYENHCPVCHDSTAHIRKDRRAQSVSDLYAWVSRWQSELKLQWKRDEIEDVVDYLNSNYYKFTAK